MKFSIILYTLILFSFSASAQLVMDGGAKIKIDGGTSGNNVFMVLTPAASTPIVSGATDGIIMEDEYNRLKYNLGTATTSITVPYMTQSLEPMPLTLTPNTAGVGAGNILFSAKVAPVRSTGFDNSVFMPSGVSNVATGIGNGNNSAFALDRFWIIDANNYTTKPGVTLNFSYLDAEAAANGGNTIDESTFSARRYNSVANDWNGYLSTGATLNTTANTLNNVTVLPADFYKAWVLNSCSTPVAYTVTGGGAYCAGGGGVAVGLSNSQTAVSYQLQIGGSNTGSPITGNGSAISFGNQTASGVYTVVATNPAGACVATMTGSVNVTADSYPSTSISSQTNVSCNGGTNGAATISATGGTGLTYNWTPSGGTAATATGLSAGSYTCTVTNSTGCSSVQNVSITEPASALGSSVVYSAYAVTTLAGSLSQGSANGTGGAASFNSPWAITTDNNGNLFVADGPNNEIRKVNIATGAVTTLAGSTTPGSADGVGAAAGFNMPWGLACDGNGNLFVADQVNQKIRKIIISTGAVSTLAGSGSPGSTDGSPSNASFYNPLGLTYDGTGNLYVADANNNMIRKVNIATGIVSTVAGTTSPGAADGIGIAASFSNPTGVAADGNGNLYVADEYNNEIRKIVLATGQVTTIAGTTNGGSDDGIGAAASFSAPISLSLDASGNLFVAEGSGNKIRKINTSTNNVTTFAGTGAYGSNNGAASSATFSAPVGVVVDANENLFVTDENNNEIRQIAHLPIQTTCNGGADAALTVAAEGGTPAYAYSWAPSGGTTATASGLSAGTYTCTISDANGCSSSQTVMVSQPAAITASVTASLDTVCSGISSTLSVTASGGVGNLTYSWNTGATTSTLTVSPTSTTSYSVTVTDANGCSFNLSKSIVVKQGPTVSITGNNNICRGTSTTLTASGASSYHWNNGPNTATNTVSPINTITYSVIGTAANGCTGGAGITVTVKSSPVISITGNNIVCSGNSTTLTASGASTYSWTNGPATASNTVSPAINTSYLVTGTGANGCTGVASRLVTVNALPTVSISGNNNICIGSSTNLTASGANTYSWNTGATTAGIGVSPTSNTTYSVTGIDANGCSNTATQIVNVNALPTVSISGANTVCAGTSTTLTASGATTYNWSTGATTAAITTTPNTTTTYTVTGTVNGCTNTASSTVTVNATPSVSVNATPSTITSGSSSTLTASGATTYSWSTGATTASTIVSPTVTTSYSVTGTTNGCSATISTTVTVSGTVSNATKLKTTYCGSTLTSTTSNFMCDAVTSATNYEYEFTDVATSVITTKQSGNSSTSLTLPTALALYGKTYNVRVKAYVNAAWGTFGTVCQLSTPPSMPGTKLTNTYCGATLTSTTSGFNCDAVASATNYEYEFTDEATSVVTLKQSGGASTNLTLPTSLAYYGKTYDVRVRAYVGSWGSFGNSCQLFTPTTIPTTKIRTVDCNTTLPTSASSFWCDAVPSATNYEYEFTDVATSVVSLKQSSGPSANMTLPTTLRVNSKTYDVRVRAYAGSWGSFGATCQITTPVTGRLANPFANNNAEENTLAATKEEIVLHTYPNPSNGTFTLQSNRAGKYMLMNELGEVIKVYNLSNENNNTQLIDGLSAGLYIVMSYQPEGMVSQKIVVTK